MRRAIAAWFAPRPTGTASAWATEHMVIPPPQTEKPGPFSLAGCEYLREFIDGFSDASVTDLTLVSGAQAGKTTASMAGIAWVIACEPCAVVWALPTADLSRSFSSTRWMPVLAASPILDEMCPRGRRRDQFTKGQQQIGGSLVNFVGSNSPGNLASRPARVVVLDEIDKFPTEGGGEADAVGLAELRTRKFSCPKRVKTSTPTLTTGLIWQAFEMGDQRRWFVPCPLCKGFVVLVWSANFSVLPKTGAEACIAWDPAARGEDGRWNLDQVERTAHAVCPHCKGKIQDGAKTRMNKAGEWRPTAKAARGFRSYHLPSLYACSPQTTFGHLAVQFLQAKRSLLGLQNFINGTLAEPYASQDTVRQRTELVAAKLEVTGEWKKILTVDCQARAPYFWHVVRAWTAGRSEAVAAGALHTWEEVERVQAEHAIPGVGVFIDSSWGARSDADVYSACMRRCELVPRPNGGLPQAIGWQPCKGFPERKRWKDDQTGLWLPYILRPIDPFLGTSNAGQVEMMLFEVSTDFFKDILDMMRARRGPHQWSVAADVATDEYWRHLDGESKVSDRSPKTGKVKYIWKRRSSHWPNHLFDCETMQLAAAAFFGLLDLGQVPEGDTRDERQHAEVPA
jgi:hypothetical protein